MRRRDIDHFPHRARRARHYNQTIRKCQGLRQIMGHQQHRGAGPFAGRQDISLHDFQGLVVGVLPFIRQWTGMVRPHL